MNFNDEQLRVIDFFEGPCQVIAGAGSGKTACVVHRIARLIGHYGVDPNEILAVTFSRSGAAEMNDRLDSLGVSGCRVGTWHSVARELVLSAWPHMRWWRVDNKGAEYRKIVTKICGYRGLDIEIDLGLFMQYVNLRKACAPIPHHIVGRRFREIFEAAEEIRCEDKLWTYNDMLVDALTVLTDDKAGSRWRFIIQDEAQDCNSVQNAIASILAGRDLNYMIVGDPAQAIFGFRGADPSLFTEFPDRFAGSERIELPKNYRSGHEIVNASNLIRARMPAELALVSMAEEYGGEIHVAELDSSLTEASFIASQIRVWLDNGIPPSEIAILYRRNAQSLLLEQALMDADIRYVVIGHIPFFKRKEVRDLMAYLRVAVDPIGCPWLEVRRTLLTPFRYLSRKFLQLAKSSKSPGDSWIDVIKEVDSSRRALDWVNLMGGLVRMVCEGESSYSILRHLIDEIDFEGYLRKTEGCDSLENRRVFNVKELLSYARKAHTSAGLIALSERFSSRSDEAQRDDAVRLMTVHKSKGLEWDNVIIFEATDRNMPIRVKFCDYYEERRLFYVAITRARKRLLITYHESICSEDDFRDHFRSPYLSEIENGD